MPCSHTSRNLLIAAACAAAGGGLLLLLVQAPGGLGLAPTPEEALGASVPPASFGPALLGVGPDDVLAGRFMALGALAALIGALAHLAIRAARGPWAGPAAALVLVAHPAATAAVLDPAAAAPALGLALLCAAASAAWGRVLAAPAAARAVSLPLIGLAGVAASAPALSPGALAALLAPSGVAGGVSVAIALALAILAALGVRAAAPRGAVLGLGLALFGAGLAGGGAPLAAALSVSLLMAPAFGRSARGRAETVVSAASLCVLLLAGRASALRAADASCATREAFTRLASGLASLEPLGAPGVDILVGVDEIAARALAARRVSGPMLTASARWALLPDPGPGAAVRLLRFAAPLPGAPPRLDTVFAARQAPAEALALDAPADGARFEAGSARDEPVFVFSVPAARDPGPAAFLFFAVVVGGSGTPISRRLDPSVLERRLEGGRALYTWRPSWRSQASGERELRWEYGDLAPPGGVLSWTVAAAGRDGHLVSARPRRLRAER